MTILVTKKQHFWPDPHFWSSFWLVNMGMAKKEIFNTQFKQIFCQLDVIKQLFFVFRAFRDKFCLFWGGGRHLFSFFSRILFFPFVILFYSKFCCPLYCLSFVWSFADFAFFFFYRKSLNKKLNGSMKKNCS